MHGESCPAALANDAASGVPGSGRPEEHPTQWQPLPVSLRERLPGFASCSSSAASSSPLLFSLPPLLPPSGTGGSSIGGPALVCACARPPSLPLDPPPHPSYPPPSLPSQTGSRFSPLGPRLRRERGGGYSLGPNGLLCSLERGSWASIVF